MLTQERPKLHHIETSQLICLTNRLAGFYMMATVVFNVLILCLFFTLCCILINVPGRGVLKTLSNIYDGAISQK